MKAHLLFAPIVALAACGPAEVSGSIGVTTPVYVGSPTLAYVAPGVEVVVDRDSPVFFADNFYWYWDGGIWYRAETFGGPRVVVREVPRSVAAIREPGRYAHYRAPEHVAHGPIRRAPMGHERMEHRR